MHIYTRNLANAALSIRVTLNTKPDGRFWLLHNLNRNLVSRQTDWIVAGRGSSLLTWPNPRSMMDQTRHDQKLKWNSGPDSFCTTCRKNLLTLILQLIKQVVKTFWRQAASQGRIFFMGTMWCDTDQFRALQPACRSPAVVVLTLCQSRNKLNTFVSTLSKGRNFARHCWRNRQRCRSNIWRCRKNRSTCSIRQCCFDNVAGVDGALRDAGPTTQRRADSLPLFAVLKARN